jgi:16S rRNA (adenine1518-N6/adenine1519-N6)-dimethyltransferase
MTLPSIQEHARMHGILAKKSLGQNFLFDTNITDKVVSHAGKIEGKDVIEIGPGPGGLTRSILKQNPHKLVVIEKDARCIDLLRELQQYHPSLEIIEEDAMKFDLSSLGLLRPKIISNLPYNIGTELLFKWIEQIEHFADFTLMFQKEVADRICAKENDNNYGRLSVMVALVANAQKCFDLSPKAFTPPPKVFSSVIHIVPKQDQYPKKLLNYAAEFVKQAFSARRKMIRKNLSGFLDSEDFIKLDIPETLRAENISPENYIKICEYYLSK